jgi:hypothetical protein
MTDNFNENADQNNNGKGRRPTHAVKVRHVYGDGATSFEQIGVGWKKESGKSGIKVKLAGTQVVSEFYLFELPQSEDTATQAAS